MSNKPMLAVAAILLSAGVAQADPIEGNWKTEAGPTAAISSCDDSFCIQLTSGKYAGKNIGRFKATGNNAYEGKITDPANDKSFSGKASVSGATLELKGCALGGMACKTQTWSRL